MSEIEPVPGYKYKVLEIAATAIGCKLIAVGAENAEKHTKFGKAIAIGSLTAGLWVVLYCDSQIQRFDDAGVWLDKSKESEHEGAQVPNQSDNDLAEMTSPIGPAPAEVRTL